MIRSKHFTMPQRTVGSTAFVFAIRPNRAHDWVDEKQEQAAPRRAWKVYRRRPGGLPWQTYLRAEAQALYAEMFFTGKGVPKSDSEGLKWLRAAAEQDHTDSLMRLAMRYQDGNGVVRDPAMARKLFRRAAGLGHPQAQFMLAWTYLEGADFPRDLPEAFKWLTLAAAQKSDYSQHRDLVVRQMTSTELAEGRRRLAAGKQ